ncbi:MAG: serpin family protein, partial [Candidatus Marinimicrobia bacterium]|nr:serpin family protein [Candidatus Neomarinimicrobiota bacterium]
MRRMIAFSIITLICIITINCSDIFTNQNDSKLKVIRDLTSSEIVLKESSNQFGLTLFRKIAETEPNENIFLSPLSVSMALGMTYNGANSTTLEAMHETLEYGDLTIQEVNESYLSLITLLTDIDPKVIFDIANSIWCRNSFHVENSFISTNQDYFDALVQSLDFSRSDAADIINTWVNDNTNGKIEEIVTPPIDVFTVMFLINAIYFNGRWTFEFDPENTETAPFFLPDNSQIDCQMMSYKCEHSYFSNDQFQAVDLPYGDGKFRMMVILPNVNIDIDAFITNIDNTNWNIWLNQFEKTEINL